MKASYLKAAVEQNELSNIIQISTTSLIRVFGERIKPGSIVVDEVNEIFSYVDASNGTKISIDITDINGIIGTPEFVFPV